MFALGIAISPHPQGGSRRMASFTASIPTAARLNAGNLYRFNLPSAKWLISASGGRETVKLWDLGTRQELLTLRGAGSMLFEASWSADGDVNLAGDLWQAWRAPSWAEIAAAEMTVSPSQSE